MKRVKSIYFNEILESSNVVGCFPWKWHKNNMPLVYNQSNDENYPQITSMLRKTKRDETRLVGAASKRPALAALTNLQNVPTHSTDLGKQIRQRQTNPFSIRVDTKKPSPKQKQIATRSQRTSCSSSRLHSVASTVRQSTLSSFRANMTSSSAAPSFAASSAASSFRAVASTSNVNSATSSFPVFRDRSSSSSATASTSSAPSFAALRDRSNIPDRPALGKTAECPMSVDRSSTGRALAPSTGRAPLAPPTRTPLRSRNISMEIDDTSNQSDMSIDLTDGKPVPVIRDIDADANKVFDSPEYVQDIDIYLRKMEEQYKPRPSYMAKQRQISYSHRCTVVDWMYEVCDEFHMGQKTFELAVSYLDRFLSKMSMPRKNLQLLGTTTLFIAHKVEEIEQEIGLAARFVWITNNTYTIQELFRMECMILNKLGFEMNSTTTNSFQDRFLKASEADCRETYMTEYLCDRALVYGEKFLKYTPSVVTSAAVALSRATFRPEQPTWTPTLAHYTKYSYYQLQDCMTDLLAMHKSDFHTEDRPFAAVWNKYSLPRYMMILRKTPLDSIPESH